MNRPTLNPVLLILALGLFGCSGGSSGGSGLTDTDVTEQSDTPSDTEQDDGAPMSDSELSDVTAASLCAVVGDFVAECGGSASDCDQAIAEDCESLLGIVSEDFALAAASCLISGGVSLGECFYSALLSLTPTEAHLSFAAAFCAECMLGVPGCESLFFDPESEDASAGLVILPLGDSLVTALEEQCTTGMTCAVEFNNCAKQVLIGQGMPEDSLACFLDVLLNGPDENTSCIPDTGDDVYPDAGDSGGTDVGDAGTTEVVDDDVLDSSADAPCLGCIDELGDCIAGDSEAACGIGGVPCDQCVDLEQCDEGICSAPSVCNETCSGCCDGETCIDTPNDDQCGVDGAACADCEEGNCDLTAGMCMPPCETTCDGCCLPDGTCVDGLADDACGQWGLECNECGDEQVCFVGFCLAESCRLSCLGCCMGDVCIDGFTDDACGQDGAVCEDCGAGRYCSIISGCQPESESRWDVVVVSATVPLTNPEGESWDPIGGPLPDPQIFVRIMDGDERLDIGGTDMAVNTYTPTWDEVVLEDLTLSELMDYEIHIAILDVDIYGFMYDEIAECEHAFFDTEWFNGENRTFECGDATFTQRVQVHVD